MRRSRQLAAAALATVVATGIGVAPVPEAAVSAANRTCDVSGAVVLAASPQVRVYRLPKTKGRQVFACYVPRPWVFALDSPREGEDRSAVTAVAVSGSWICYALQVPTPNDDPVLVSGLNMKTRQGSSSYAIASNAPQEDSISGLVINSRGNWAWIAYANFGSDMAERQVLSQRASSRRATLLDSGLDIAPRSLALSVDGRTIYWKHGGADSSARITPGP